jgi:hypothetical protein
MLIRDPISGLWDAFSANCVPVRRPLTIGAILGFKSFSEIRFIKGLGQMFQDLESGELINQRNARCRSLQPTVCSGLGGTVRESYRPFKICRQRRILLDLPRMYARNAMYRLVEPILRAARHKVIFYIGVPNFGAPYSTELERLGVLCQGGIGTYREVVETRIRILVMESPRHRFRWEARESGGVSTSRKIDIVEVLYSISVCVDTRLGVKRILTAACTK